MLSLILIGGIETLVFVEVPIDLFNLWHFPTVMLLSMREAIVLLASKYLGLSAHGKLVVGVVELLPQLFFDFLIVIPGFIAIELLPSLGLGCSETDWLLFEHALTWIGGDEIVQEDAVGPAHILSAVHNVISPLTR